MKVNSNEFILGKNGEAQWLEGEKKILEQSFVKIRDLEEGDFVT